MPSGVFPVDPLLIPAVTVALSHTIAGYAPLPAGLTLYGVDASALPTDEALMLAWAAGDVHAFESLYARHRKRLFGFLLRQLRDTALVDRGGDVLVSLHCDFHRGSITSGTRQSVSLQLVHSMMPLMPDQPPSGFAPDR